MIICIKIIFFYEIHMKYRKSEFFIILLFSTMSSIAMREGLTVYSISGQNELGSEPEYIELDEDDQIEIFEAPTPGGGTDIEQDKYIKTLEQIINKQSPENIIQKQNHQHQNALNSNPLVKNKLFKKNEFIDLFHLQPNPQQFKTQYDALLQEKGCMIFLINISWVRELAPLVHLQYKTIMH